MKRKHYPSVPARFRTRGTGQLNGAKPKKGARIDWPEDRVFRDFRKQALRESSFHILNGKRYPFLHRDSRGRHVYLIDPGKPNHAARAMLGGSGVPAPDWRALARAIKGDKAGERGKSARSMRFSDRGEIYTASTGRSTLTPRQHRRLWKKAWTDPSVVVVGEGRSRFVEPVNTYQHPSETA